MIFPIETKYDGNTLSVTDDCDGTYCLVDLEKWSEQAFDTTEKMNIVDNSTNTAHALSYSSDSRFLEIYFLLYLQNDVSETKKEIANAVCSLRDYCNEQSITVNIHFFSYSGSKTISLYTLNDYAENSSTDDDILDMLMRNVRINTTNIDKSCYYSSDIIETYLFPDFKKHPESSKQFYILDNGFEPKTFNSEKSLENRKNSFILLYDKLQSCGIKNINVFCDMDNSNIDDYKRFLNDNSPKIINSSFSDSLYKEIKDNIDFTQSIFTSYNVNTGFCTNIPYNISNISEDWVYYYNQYYSSNLSKAEQNGNKVSYRNTYILESGKKYLVKVTVTSKDFEIDSYDVSFEQDNWVYAPNGGVWTLDEYGAPLAPVSATIKQLYITPQLLADATLNDSKEYTIYRCYNMQDVDKIIAMITYIDPTSESTIKDHASNAFTYGGMVLLFVGFAVPGIREGSLLWYITTYGGAASTSYGFLEKIMSQLELSESAHLKNVICEGNLSIICSYNPMNAPLAKCWDEWNTVPYINKFNSGNRGIITDIDSTMVKSWIPFKS